MLTATGRWPHSHGNPGSKHRKRDTWRLGSIRFPSPEKGDQTGANLLTWIGNDERGRELEIVAVDRPDCLLAIHVMPAHYRRKKP